MKPSLDDLEKIAKEYHTSENVADKFIEDICQVHCCEWLGGGVRSSHDVLELGYGEGITTRQLKSLAKTYSVIEGSPTLASIARGSHPDIFVIEQLFEDFAPQKRYDKVLALHVLEHVEDPVALAKTFGEWLKPGGELVVIVPNRNSLHRQIALEMGLISSLGELSPRDKLVGHRRVYSPEEIERDLGMAGFQIQERKGFFVKILPNSMMINFPPELVIALNKIESFLPYSSLANLGYRATWKG